MVKFDYLESIADANELIEEFGRSVAIRRLTNLGTDLEPAYENADETTHGARVDFSWKQLQGGNVQASDQRWLIAVAGLSGPISSAEALVVDGSPLTIVSVDPINPAGTVVLYDCQVRA